MSRSSLLLRRTARCPLAWVLGLVGIWFLVAGEAAGQEAAPPGAPAADVPDLPLADPADPAAPAAEAAPAEPAPPAEEPPVVEQRPYEVLPIDSRAEAERIKALGVIKTILLAQQFGPGEQEIFDNHFKGYALPRWTQPQNATLLPGFRVELQRLLWFGKTGPPHDRLNDLIIEVFTPVLTGHFHPAAQANAALMIGELNAVEPVPSGPPPEPLPAALDLLMRVAGDAARPDAVRVAALVGVLRHVRLWQARVQTVSGSSLPGAAAQVSNLAMSIALRSAPPPGRSPEGHAWMRAQALTILGELGPVGNTTVAEAANAPLAKVLAGIAAEQAAPLGTRLSAAQALGRVRYQGAAGLNPSELAMALGQAAVDSCAAETNPVSRRRLKARLAMVWFGLTGQDWAPTGSPGDGAVVGIATAEPHQAVVANIRESLNKMLAVLDNTRLDDASLALEIAPLRDGLAQLVRKQP